MAYVFRSKSKQSRKIHSRWRFQYTDWQGRRRTATGTTSKVETKKLAERVQSEHDEIRKGFRPPPNAAKKHLPRNFGEVVDEYLAWGESQGGRGGRPWAQGHARMRRSYLTWWEERLGLECLGDLCGSLGRVEKTLREIQSKNRTGKTVQNYAEALRGFTSWCLTRGYLAEDPFKGLERFDITPQTTRRAMTQQEICRLLMAAPEHRRLLYGVAFCSGLRAGELRALSTDDLDVERGGLHLRPSWTKNRKPGFQPLPASLIQGLVAFADSRIAPERYRKFYRRRGSHLKHPENPLLYVPSHTARDLEQDLTASGIPKWTSEGKVDFHACRVAFVTFLFESGASVKEAQVLARHATADLTMNIYARTRESRLAEVAEEVGKKILPLPSIAIAQRGSGRHITHCAAESYMVEAAGIEPASGSVSA